MITKDDLVLKRFKGENKYALSTLKISKFLGIKHNKILEKIEYVKQIIDKEIFKLHFIEDNGFYYLSKHGFDRIMADFKKELDESTGDIYFKVFE